MSEQVNELFTALSKAQGELRLVEKKNTGGFKGKYADLASFIKQSRDVLAKNDLIVTQLTAFENGSSVLITILGHKSGQWIKGIMPLICTKNTPQEFGSAVSYARRYAFTSIINTTGGDDDDDGLLAQTGVEMNQREERERAQLILDEKELKESRSKLQEAFYNDKNFADKVWAWLNKERYFEIETIPLHVIKTVLARYDLRKEEDGSQNNSRND
jgi:hypothetical protein